MSQVEVSFDDTLILVNDDGRRFILKFTSMSAYPIRGSISGNIAGTRIEAKLEGFEIIRELDDCDLGV